MPNCGKYQTLAISGKGVRLTVNLNSDKNLAKYFQKVVFDCLAAVIKKVIYEKSDPHHSK
jgi:hypothetical protein